ncbi:MAG: cytidylate kinase-like family protein [Bacteroides uniformis]|nr:cytidylate kinase-like family protein [Bacteroides uniformis]
MIGRCADFVLRDRPNCFRVFVRADMQQARNRVVEEYSIPIENAETEIEKVDKERATHYWRYTGKSGLMPKIMT